VNDIFESFVIKMKNKTKIPYCRNSFKI